LLAAPDPAPLHLCALPSPTWPNANWSQWVLQTRTALDVAVSNPEESVSTTTAPAADVRAAAGCLSWGRSGELLVAGSALDLFQTSPPEPERIWHKRLSSPAQLASLSYDSAFLATVGAYDGLVKLWRRLSYGSDDVRFDFAYLRHPQPVTSLQWRRPHHVDESMDNVLFTLCADNVLRIWAGSDMHGQQHPQLWGKLDLASALLGSPSHPASHGADVRVAMVIHQRDFRAAVETAVQAKNTCGPDTSTDVALQHMVTIANYSPDVCLVFDGAGRMSAWALENIGCKTAKPSNIFNIVHAESPDLALFPTDELRLGPYPHVEGYNYCDRPAGRLQLLFHRFDGLVDVFEGNVAQLFDPETAHGRRRQRRVSTWTGHSAAIEKMVRNFSGSAVVSRTGGDECVVWKHSLDEPDVALSRQCAIVREEQTTDRIRRICVLRKGRFVVLLGLRTLSVWDCRGSRAVSVGRVDYSASGTPLCLLILPRAVPEDSLTAYVATITTEKEGIVWELSLPHYSQAGQESLANGEHPRAREFCRFSLDTVGDLAYALPVDPAGASPGVSGFLDVFARDVAVSYTHQGRVDFWTARVSQPQRRVEWLLTASMETAIVDSALVNGSTLKKAAMVNASRTSVSIWDIRAAQLEFSHDVDQHGPDPVQDLDWTSTPDGQSILALGFLSRVVLLSQMRFDYLNHGPAWAPIREIKIDHLTPHPIGDSTWLRDGNLVVGAGNQLFVYDRRFDASSSMVASLRLPLRRDGHWDLFDVVQRLNGPLPVFHPQFLSQCVLAGKTRLVHRVLEALHQTLKFHVEGEHVDEYLGLDMETFYLDPSVGPPSHLTDPDSLARRVVRRMDAR
jgi:WD40 repeat protein